MEGHRCFSPQCPLVRQQDNATAGNPGGHSDPTEAESSPPPAEDTLREESQRRQTFSGWPLSSPSPEALARAGFFFLGRGTEVKCAFCGIRGRGWEIEDEPMEDHRRFSPQCPLVLEQDNGTTGIYGIAPDPTEAARPSAPPAEDINEETQRRLSREQNTTTAGIPGDGEPSAPTAAIPPSAPPAEDIREELQRRLVRESDRGSSQSVDQEPASQFASAATLSPMAADNGSLRDDRSCIICMDAEPCMLFMPCGHLVTCVQCAPELQLCCVCRAPITGRVRAYTT